MTGCCAFGCSNRSQDYRMYVIPSGKNDQERRKIWILRIKRAGQLPKSARLCEVHFEPSQFETNIPGKLKPNAVPSIFVHSAEPSHREPPRKRQMTDSVHFNSDLDPHAICVDHLYTKNTESQQNLSNLMTPEIITPSINPVLESNLPTFEDMQALKRSTQLLKKNLQKLEKENEELKTSYSKLFNVDQVKFLSNPCKKITWSDESIERALQLRISCGLNGYNMLLSQGFPLPSARTLRRKLQQIAFNDGFTEVCKMLSLKVQSMSAQEKISFIDS